MLTAATTPDRTSTPYAARLTAAITGYEPRGRALAVARTLVAAATLLEVVFARPDDLVAIRPGQPGAAGCAGPAALSLWCLGPAAGTHLLTRQIVTVVVLLVVVSGFWPRWTCVPHWYVVFSLNSGMTLPNGGDRLAVIATFLLIPVLVTDRRPSLWQPPDAPLPLRWRGAAYAAMILFRVQLLVVYVVAALSKLAHGEWRDGSAMGSIARNTTAGMPDWVMATFGPVLDHQGPGLVLAWSVMGVELAIGLLVIGPPQVRRWSVVLAVALHVAIGVLMGLVEFAVMMIGMVVLASVSTARPAAARPAVAPAIASEELS